MVNSAYIFDVILPKIKEAFPTLDIRFGYIGNVYATDGVDNRRWDISARPYNVGTVLECKDIYYLSTNTRTKKWNEETMFDLNEEHLMAWLQKQKERYNG